MLTQFSEHIATNFPYLKDKKLLVAISGGIDSVVLTELLYKLDYNISLAHCNFQLRGLASNQDEAFVNALAGKLQLSIVTKKFNTKAFAKKEKLSIQLAARELRYNWFAFLLQEYKFDYLLTAHHADDNLETFLINLSRGTGLDGLLGIPEQNQNSIRPLLPFSRNQIEQYAKANNITWREDSSNSETKYIRNKLRHDVIPALKEINPQFLEAFSNTILNLKETQKIVANSVNTIKQKVIVSEKKGIVKLDIEALYKIPHSNAYLYELLKEYNFTAWNDIYKLLTAQSGKFVLSNTHRILKDRKHLLVSPIDCNSEPNFYSVDSLQKSIRTDSFEFSVTPVSSYSTKINSNMVFIDSDKINWPLTIRKWQEGDYFYPFGMQGKKKLSKFFKDKKLSVIEKENCWVLTSDAAIVWVIGYRLDERFKISESTTSILQLKISEK
ncbi:tRNA lysidine(34) synthetase TilS [Aureibaculum marinum]|uniref:tRNA(Ile)-lysidine synthase n=2 Tax=Pseudomonadati TaxID=3379134 RepID=A0A3N4NQ15_9FLAO|nr:tRNA lysidine(34) synthetase TilS [Aureibaculum marinum]